MDNTQPLVAGTGLTLPINIVAGSCFFLSKIFIQLSIMPLANLALYVTIVSGSIGAMYGLFKLIWDFIKAMRENKKYHEENDD